MRILIVHNKYKVQGGEETIVSVDEKGLQNRGHQVYTYFRDNSEMDDYSITRKLLAFKNGYYSKDTVRDIQKVIDQFKPEVAHVHNVYPLISPSVYDVLHKNRIPIVQTLHNYRFLCPNGLMYTKGNLCELCVEKKDYYQCARNRCYHDSTLYSLWYSGIINHGRKTQFHKVSKFIALQPFMKLKMVQGGYDENKIEILANGIPKPEASTDADKENYFVFIGRLSGEKGIRQIVTSVGNNHKIRLKVIGDGPEKAWLIDYLAQNSISNIEYLGYKKGNEKNDIIAAAAAVIVPSDWYENQPTVIIEANALGTPVIVPDIGAMAYMIEGGNGITFNYRDYEDLISKMLFIAGSQEAKEKMSEASLKVFHKKYSIDKHLDGLIRIYSSLVD